MDEHIAQVLMAWRQECVYTKQEDWVWASPHKQGREPYWPQTIMKRFIQRSRSCRHNQKHWLPYLPAHVLDADDVTGRGSEGSARADATRFVPDHHGQLHAGPGRIKAPCAETLGRPDHADREVGHA